LEVLFTGVGNAFTEGGLSWSGVLVDSNVLLDAPPSTMPKLLAHAIDPDGIDAVLLSHFHGDHFAGLPFLLLHLAARSNRRREITIAGPPGVRDRVNDLIRVTGIGVERDPPPFERRFVDVRDGLTLDVAGGRVEVRRMQHAPSLEAFGYRFARAGATVAYSGDTTLCPALIDLGRGVDLLIVECSSAEEEDPDHMNLRLVRELREALGPEPKILLTHRSADVAPRDILNVEAAEEGRRYAVPVTHGAGV
jgi:ribonuclease BN (tRNA processing enzyme)